MRVFVAASLDRFDDLQALMADLSTINDCRAVKTPQLHLTFRFFGEVENSDLAVARNEFRKISGNRFELNIKGLGAFPNKSRANVLFLDVESNPEITANYESINLISPHIGNGKKFRPHITVARFRKGHDCRELCTKYQSLSFSKQVTRISMYRSELTAEGPVYTEIEELQL